MPQQATLTLYHCAECGAVFNTEEELMAHKTVHLSVSEGVASEQKPVLKPAGAGEATP